MHNYYDELNGIHKTPTSFPGQASHTESAYQQCTKMTFMTVDTKTDGS